jgi:ABC-type nitrate/sulfonate/bicarbonate transport system ATPase subunit
MRETTAIIQGISVQAAVQTNVFPLAGSADAAAAKPTPLLELHAVSKTFGYVTALSKFEASVAKGEFVTVVGPSGCGKSTLFNIVAGLDEPDAGGALRFEGNSCHASDLLGRVAFMPQRDLLLPWRNVVDNAILALDVEGVPRAQARAKALEMLPEFGLAGFEAQYPNQLSGGMRQRVALMRTFLFERDLMLLDEPFGALDALTRAIMQRWLLDVWQKHRRTILFITHDVDEAIFLGDRVLVMTARPGSVKLEQVVDLPRPRRPEIVTAPEFVRLKRTLLDAIEEESIKSFQFAVAEEKPRDH